MRLLFNQGLTLISPPERRRRREGMRRGRKEGGTKYKGKGQRKEERWGFRDEWIKC